MTVKDNQPTLHADLDLLFSRAPEPAQDLRHVEQTSKGHGRLETRTLWASADVKGYIDWPALEQGLCLERRVITLSTGEITPERVYGLINLTPDQLDLSKVLQRWRGHWGKDVLLKEDASRLHTGQAPLILATLRNLLVSCLHALGFASITQGRRHFALNFDEAIACICGPLE
jgi:hypothetical protein